MDALREMTGMYKQTSIISAVLCTVLAGLTPAFGQEVAAEGVRVEHSLERSGFQIGENARMRGDVNYEVVEGSRGAFYTDLRTGYTLATLNGSDEQPRPLSNSAETHNAEARRYLAGVGVPENEVGGMHVTTTMINSGSVLDGIDPANARLLYYTTHLERFLGGVSVEGSLAFAAFDADRRVITEGIYWPAIASATVASAQAFARRLSDATASAEYLGILKSKHPEIGNTTGSVKIVHTGSSYTGEFAAKTVYVVYAKPSGEGMYAQFFFDEQGQSVSVELPSGAQGSGPRRR
jgi:hypothetical protein